MFDTQKKENMIHIVLMFSLLVLIGIGITENSLDPNVARPAPERPVQPDRSSLRNENTPPNPDHDSRPATQVTGSLSTPVSDSRLKVSGLQAQKYL